MKVNGFRVQTEGIKPWKEGEAPKKKRRAGRHPETEGPNEILACLTCDEPVCNGGMYCRRLKAGKQADVDAGRKKTRSKNPIPEDFLEKFESGMSLKKIARSYHVADETIYSWLFELGVEPRGRKRKAQDGKKA